MGRLQAIPAVNPTPGFHRYTSKWFAEALDDFTDVIGELIVEL
jgi:hypothetical protein